MYLHVNMKNCLDFRDDMKDTIIVSRNSHLVPRALWTASYLKAAKNKEHDSANVRSKLLCPSRQIFHLNCGFVHLAKSLQSMPIR